jgi:hypothetical protein
MSKFNCTCGHQISDVQWPTAFKAHLITDVAWDTHSDYSMKPVRMSTREVPQRHVWECQECGRLWIQESPDGAKYREFVSVAEKLKMYEDESK